MGTSRIASRRPTPQERTSAAPASARSTAARATPVQLLQRQLGNQGTADFVSRITPPVSEALHQGPEVPSPNQSMPSSRIVPVTPETASTVATPSHEKTPPDSPTGTHRDAGHAATASSQPAKSDVSHQPAEEASPSGPVKSGAAPHGEKQKVPVSPHAASASVTPVHRQAAAKAADSPKAATSEAKPVAAAPAGAHAEMVHKKQPAPSARHAMAPLVTVLHHRAATARNHSAPGVPVASAQAAAIRPGVEQTRAAAVQTVANLDAAKTGQIKRDDFKAKLKKAIKDATPQPKTEAQADELMKTGAAKASSTVKGELSAQNEAAAGQLKSATTTDVPPSSQPKPNEASLQPEPVGGAPAPVAADPAVPPPLPAEQLDYSSDRAPTDKAMADAGVTKEQLEEGNEPEFKQNLSARTEADKHEAAAEQGYRKNEAGIREHVEKSAHAEISQGLAGIHEARKAKIGSVVEKQHATKEKDAAEHQAITDWINAIKNETRQKVEEILGTMEKEAGDIFEKGLADAEKAYEDTFEEEKGGIGTWLTTWGSDWEELIERSLVKAREKYLAKVDEAIDRVADCVDAKLEAAKRRVAEGRSQVETYVKGLDANVRGFGETALKAVAGDFEQMTGEIDQRRDALVNKLTEQYKASYERMSAMEEKLREENKSLWQRIYDATVGLIKKILAFKDMLLNVLARAAEAIGTIIAHPIAFLGHLVDAGKLGFSNFSDHIVEHLKAGFMEWLFGAVAETGIQLPKNFDLQGILSLVQQILGLTYSNIRARAVKILGEKVVKALETAAEIFKILITKGPAGLWEYIKEKIGDLKAMVIEKIKAFVMEKIVMAGITWIIGLLNPASAFFKACKAIYDIVMFFVQHGKQILDLVNAIIDSISSIAKGAIGAAAKFVETSLARTIPVIIGFLAALLGVGGISEKIKEIIEAIRKPINEAIDWVITKAVDLIKAVGGLLGFGKEEPVAKTDDPEHDAKVTAGLTALDEEDEKHEKDGKITEEGAKQVAATVKSAHPIFKTLEVREGEETWDYEFSASERQSHKGARRDTQIPDKRFLPPDFDVRRHLYENGSGFGSAKSRVKDRDLETIRETVRQIRSDDTTEVQKQRLWKTLVKNGQVPENEDRDKYTVAKVNAQTYNVDHIHPLAKHWIDQGYNCADEPRQDLAGQEENLQLTLESYNKSKQAEGAHYKDRPFVGPAFSSNYNESPTRSLKILGQSFRDENEKALK